MRKIDYSAIDAIWRATPEIVAVWVFGSAKDGTVKDGSDIDIGVLFQANPTLEQLSDLRAKITKTLETEEVDLCSLNTSSPILQFEAASGKCLFDRNPAEKATFVSLVAREYEDTMGMLAKSLKD